VYSQNHCNTSNFFHPYCIHSWLARHTVHTTLDDGPWTWAVHTVDINNYRKCGARFRRLLNDYASTRSRIRWLTGPARWLIDWDVVWIAYKRIVWKTGWFKNTVWLYGWKEQLLAKLTSCIYLFVLWLREHVLACINCLFNCDFSELTRQTRCLNVVCVKYEYEMPVCLHQLVLWFVMAWNERILGGCGGFGFP